VLKNILFYKPVLSQAFRFSNHLWPPDLILSTLNIRYSEISPIQMKPQELAPISVIMPAFNSEDTVGDAIQSVIAQTYTNLELIIVDDGSDDKTCQVIEAFADRRIKLIKHDRNKGQGAARNTAIAAASGDWITLIDADDFWAGERLEKLLEPTKHLGSRVMIADDIFEFYQTSGGIKPWRRVWKRQMRFAEERYNPLHRCRNHAF